MKKYMDFKDNCGFGLLASIDNNATHKNVEDAIVALERMMHRGAVAADGKSGDGSGFLFGMPYDFMQKIALQNGHDLPKQFAVAMVFMQNEEQKNIINDILAKNDLKVIFYRDVPINKKVLGEFALDQLPNITQIFVSPNTISATRRFELSLYLARKEIENKLKEYDEFYICSFSNKTISYKGLVMPTHIKKFYLDLSDKDFKTTFALFHQRFSTNTLPQWKLAQPFRSIAHNGEINSIAANRFNLLAKSEHMKSLVFTDKELRKIFPITTNEVSDSASLDNIFEFLLANGMDFFKAARVLIPEAWQNAPHMDSDMRAFYEYMSTCFEAWDGPAAVSLTDGRHVGCILDRNGLRPAKYIITKDKRIIISSEYGILDIEENNVIERGKLKSGEMIGLDLKYGKILKNEDINNYLKDLNPYGKWLNHNMIYLQEFVDIPFTKISDYEIDNIYAKQRIANITYEAKDMVIFPMMNDGKENTGSMGDDTPLAAFSDKQRCFTDFFKQKFAQVTNPPIDSIRERIVMSLNTGFGEIRNILEEDINHAKRLKIITPVLMQEKLEILLSFGDPNKPRYDKYYKNKIFSTLFEENLKGSLNDLAYDIVDAVKEDGVRIIVLDDRGVNKKLKQMPMAMVIGKVNQILLEEGVRHLVSIVAVTSEPYDSHSTAVLIAYGASAVYPYLLFATVLEECKNKKLSSYETRIKFKNVLNSLNLGLLKIMSKMGISTIASYRNSGLMDVIGLSKEVVQDCFNNSACIIPGLGYDDIEKRIKKIHKEAFVENENNIMFPIKPGGFYKYIQGEEFHCYAPNVIFAMHQIANNGKKEDFKLLKERSDGNNLKRIRDFFELHSDKKPIKLDEVEPKENIFKRFSTAAMSLGSISPEAHETLAKAMNTIGGKSNSGEGGEKPERLKSPTRSKIKQIASGRFGVTPEYLRSAEEIQIKLAQGAKPGEGGQLPGHKVSPLIASLRYTMPGVTLISPPPHHDIYSIEDLAQLIFDLKQINPDAMVSVKLVSSSHVGTIAAGVAKCYADKIIISGTDGGTGAAPLTSIKFAGDPWEIGLSETHNTLKVNHLREFVRLETDGGLRTGLDIVKAAMLGAESYAFGTGALALLGCKMLRICHLNKCSTGIATQNGKLREHFNGNVQKIINYFTLLAEDVREILATLGYKSIEEIVGRSDLLKVIDNEMAKKFDFSSILERVEGINTCQKRRNDPFDKNLFEKEILQEVYPTIQNPNSKIVIKKKIKNTNRSFGVLISGEIAKFYGNKGLPEDSIVFKLKGTSGQSFGAFLVNGISLELDGMGNDYVGKGMNGGKIIITPKNQGDNFSSAGNACLYGATGGKFYAVGSVGERFCVRNSGATAVVEGTGDQACEYMTGGVALILGNTGINFGAGMTGGVAFVYDKDRGFIDRLNQELVVARRIDSDETDEAKHFLKKLLKEYLNETGSNKAKFILENFRNEVREFWMIRPKDLTKTPLNPNEGD